MLCGRNATATNYRQAGLRLKRKVAGLDVTGVVERLLSATERYNKGENISDEAQDINREKEKREMLMGWGDK